MIQPDSKEPPVLKIRKPFTKLNKRTDNIKQIILMAFDSECELIIHKTNNKDTALQLLDMAYQRINHFAAPLGYIVSVSHLDRKRDWLDQVFQERNGEQGQPEETVDYSPQDNQNRPPR